MIADIAFNYKHGQQIPNVEYTQEENTVWSLVYDKVTLLTNICLVKFYARVFVALEMFNESKK